MQYRLLRVALDAKQPNSNIQYIIFALITNQYNIKGLLISKYRSTKMQLSILRDSVIRKEINVVR